MKILSYNIHKGFRAGGRSLMTDPLKVAIHRLAPDLAFLQEVVGQNDIYHKRFPNWPAAPQHSYLCSDELAHNYYGKNMVYPSGHHGNALLSRYSMEQETNVDITVFRFEKRGFLHAQLRPWPELDLRLHALCLHLGLVEYERRLQIDLLCQYAGLHIPSQDPLIIAGDFNDWRQKITPIFEERLGLKEAFQEHYGYHPRTFPAWMPLSRLDRIYFRNLELKDCARLAGEPWRKLSDHLPLIATFAPPGKAEHFVET